MSALARFRLASGAIETLYAGSIIGRTWSADLRIDDPEVSEAHAMLSLRGQQLWLLALRRRFSVDGRSVDAVQLTHGLKVLLASAVELEVVAVELPPEVLGLEGPGLPPQALPGACSLDFQPYPRLVDGEDQNLTAGRELVLPAGTFRVVSIALASAGRTATRAGSGPLRIVASFDTVHVHRADGEVGVIAGQPARVISELIAVRQPMSWDELARPHWPHIQDRDLLRRRWDGLLGRLRDRLRELDLRVDLVSSTRVGLVELLLRDGDTVEDRS